MLNLLNERSKKLFIEAKKVIPGGVNSPVRAFKSVGGIRFLLKNKELIYLTRTITNILTTYLHGDPNSRPCSRIRYRSY